MRAADAGLLELAYEIDRIDSEYQQSGNKLWANTPLARLSKTERLATIVNILLLIHRDFLYLLIQQKAH
jgi:hypothetical protein